MASKAEHNTQERNQKLGRLFFQGGKYCGWLLLNSVSHPWWIHNKIGFETALEDRGYVDMGSGKAAYSEVIISRSILEAARYTLNRKNDAIPERFDEMWDGFSRNNENEKDYLSFEDEFVIDATPTAEIQWLLLPLLYDLKGRPEEIDSDPPTSPGADRRGRG